MNSRVSIMFSGWRLPALARTFRTAAAATEPRHPRLHRSSFLVIVPRSRRIERTRKSTRNENDFCIPKIVAEVHDSDGLQTGADPCCERLNARRRPNFPSRKSTDRTVPVRAEAKILRVKNINHVAAGSIFYLPFFCQRLVCLNNRDPGPDISERGNRNSPAAGKPKISPCACS